MSGTITDMPIRACSRCGALYIEDDRMYEDVNQCPSCGAILAETRPSGPDPEV